MASLCILYLQFKAFLQSRESVARTLTTKYPVAQEFIATQDTFGESGTPDQLMEKYGLDNKAIEKAVLRVLKRKA